MTKSSPRHGKWRIGLDKAALFAFAALAFTTATTGTAQSNTSVPITETATAEEKAAAVASVASQIRAEVGQLPSASKVEDFEAVILFSADQSGQPALIVCSAFDTLKKDKAIPGNAKTAMDNVCRSIQSQRGTGAITGGAGTFGPSGFSSPVISVGGGSNYTQ